MYVYKTGLYFGNATVVPCYFYVHKAIFQYKWKNMEIVEIDIFTLS